MGLKGEMCLVHNVSKSALAKMVYRPLVSDGLTPKAEENVAEFAQLAQVGKKHLSCVSNSTVKTLRVIEVRSIATES
ncbi:hypothetical protein Ct61P_11212 [Colletotrichum tofieldiae]|nr:hypothetical protein Ct61P_11212 [Colletotrichum tofieldiae]